MDIQLAGYTLHRQDRTAHSGKTRGGGLCTFVNSWCTKSKEVSRFCSPEFEYIVINCRPHYLPREFSAILFVAVYIQPQTDAGTKTALSQLYKEIIKQETTHPEGENDYRPVALTSVAMKCFERLVIAHLNTIIPATLDPHQFAYRLKRSTDDAISIALHTALSTWTKGTPM